MKKLLSFSLTLCTGFALMMMACSKGETAQLSPSQQISGVNSKDHANKNATNNASSFKVIGYLSFDQDPSDPWDNLLQQYGGVDLTKITELNIAFINPDSDGDFYYVSPDLEDIIDDAHLHNVKVFISFGGGNAPSYFHDLIDSPKRDYFIANIAQLVEDYGADGIDVDLEGDMVDSHYEKFVVHLGEALHDAGKKMTAAVATWNSSAYTDEALDQFDFINIMSYDKTGPWEPSNPGQHSPYSGAVSDLTFWHTNRGIDKYRLMLGVPFYGYGFGSGVPSEISFKDIAAQYPSHVDDDNFTVPAGGTIYYNGKPAIADKTNLALDQAGGIMIWELSQDAAGSNSLLNVIDSTRNN